MSVEEKRGELVLAELSRRSLLAGLKVRLEKAERALSSGNGELYLAHLRFVAEYRASLDRIDDCIVKLEQELKEET